MKKKPVFFILFTFVVCLSLIFVSCRTSEKPIFTAPDVVNSNISENVESTTTLPTESVIDETTKETIVLDSNEKIVEFYKQAYANTLKKGNLSGNDYVEIVPESFKLNGFRNSLTDLIAGEIFKHATANNKKVIGLPPQGDELFNANDVEMATATDNGENVSLDIKVANVDVIAKEKAGESSFFTMALEQVKKAVIESGVTWPQDKDLYDCLGIICSATGKIVVNKEKMLIVLADYSLLVNAKMREMSYKYLLNNVAVDGKVKYEMHFPKSS